jgi:hypothetical protein
VLFFTINALLFSTYRNNIFKIENLTDDVFALDIFNNKVNQWHAFDYTDSLSRNKKKYYFTLVSWLKEQQRDAWIPRASRLFGLRIEDINERNCFFFDLDMRYLSIELPRR